MDRFKLLAAAFTTATTLQIADAAHADHNEIDPDDCTSFITAGEASHYGTEVAIGRDANGNRIYNDTASGDAFSPWAMAAAFRDRSMFGEYVKVVAGNNDVIVKINDYGPFADDKNGNPRVIDLTTGAANALGVSGTPQVRIYACP